MQSLAIFGATGSIGTSTLEVLKANTGSFRLAAISGHDNVTRLAHLAKVWQPDWLVLTNKRKYASLMRILDGYHGEILCGHDCLSELAMESSIDTFVSAITGTAGLAFSYKALAYGKKVLLANKESLVASGHLMLEAARKGGGRIIPVDSEHSGAWQCLGCPDIPINDVPNIRRLILTASGGPFLDVSVENIANATVSQACQHPNWSMGQKISVDSATMMNKGLELIEAHQLFSIPASALEVVVHRQSVVHALVEYHDGSMLAQISMTSMKVPLAKALGFPDMLSSDTPFINLAEISRIDFEEPDMIKFPCLALAMDALKSGGDKPLRLNAANEVAVACFLEGRLQFGQIPEIISSVLDTSDSVSLNDLNTVMALDNDVKLQTKRLIEALV